MEDQNPPLEIEEQRELLQLLFQIRQVKGLRALLPMLQELEGVMSRHFSAEEGPDGLFEAIRVRAPYLTVRIQECSQEHPGLSTALEELNRQARGCPEARETEILQRAAGFSTRLQDHEAKETELLNDSMHTDLGGSD